jgi:hypothetical protein
VDEEVRVRTCRPGEIDPGGRHNTRLGKSIRGFVAADAAVSANLSDKDALRKRVRSINNSLKERLVWARSRQPRASQMFVEKLERGEAVGKDSNGGGGRRRGTGPAEGSKDSTQLATDDIRLGGRHTKAKLPSGGRKRRTENATADVAPRACRARGLLRGVGVHKAERVRGEREREDVVDARN